MPETARTGGEDLAGVVGQCTQDPGDPDLAVRHDAPGRPHDQEGQQSAAQRKQQRHGLAAEQGGQQDAREQDGGRIGRTQAEQGE